MELEFTEDQCEPNPIDFSVREHVLIQVIGDTKSWRSATDPWKNHSIEWCTVIWSENPEKDGAASYEISYNGLFDYTLEDMLECPGEGVFVVEGVTGYYTRGDGWMTDDDMEFYFETVRPATQQEIDENL